MSARVQVQEKYCRGCKRVRPAGHFTKNRARRDGLADICRACTSKAYQNYRHYGRYVVALDPETPRVDELEAAAMAADAQELAADAEARALAARVPALLHTEPSPAELQAVADTQADGALAESQATHDAMPLYASEKPATGLVPFDPMTDAIMDATDTLADFLALSESPSAFVHPRFCVLAVPGPEGLFGLWIVTPESGGPRAMVPAALVPYIVGLLAGTPPEHIEGRMYY